MICPFRIERKSSWTVQEEFYDRFCDCIEKVCPCYEESGKEKWCYRDNIRLPLNGAARKKKEEGAECGS